MRKLLIAASCAALLSAAALPPVLAQSNGQDNPPFGMMGGGCPMMGMMGQGMMGQGRGIWGQGMMGNRQANMAAIAEGRLAYLKGELKITDAQKAAWDAYADAINARIETMQSLRAGMFDAMQKGGAIDRMNARIQGMQAMLDAMSAVKEPTEKLYGVLTAEQKKIADDLIGLDCGAM